MKKVIIILTTLAFVGFVTFGVVRFIDNNNYQIDKTQLYGNGSVSPNDYRYEIVIYSDGLEPAHTFLGNFDNFSALYPIITYEFYKALTKDKSGKVYIATNIIGMKDSVDAVTNKSQIDVLIMSYGEKYYEWLNEMLLDKIERTIKQFGNSDSVIFSTNREFYVDKNGNRYLWNDNEKCFNRCSRWRKFLY